MKLSEERWQRLMKLLPKWEKGKTWQSMFPDKVLAALRAREMDRWICQRKREEEWLGVIDRRRLELGMALAVKVSMGRRFGDRDGTDREWSWD